MNMSLIKGSQGSRNRIRRNPSLLEAQGRIQFVDKNLTGSTMTENLKPVAPRADFSQRMKDGLGHLLFADDHLLIQETMAIALAQKGWANTVLAPDFQTAYAIASGSDGFDVILLDLKMPGMHGMEGVRSMVALQKGPVAVITGSPYVELVDEVIHAGGSGILTKNTKIGALPTILSEIAQGGFFCSSQLRVSEKKPEYGVSANLTAVAELITQGLTDQEISTRLGKPLSTVKMQVRRIFQVLDVKNRTQAANAWYRLKGGGHGLVIAKPLEIAAIAAE